MSYQWVMDVSRPYSAVCPTLEGDVLVVLAGTKRPLTGREVAKLVKQGSQVGVNRALRRLAEQGLVEAQEAGPAILYALNREHVAARIVELLAGLRDEFLRRLKESLSAWKIAPLHASLFGSAARADGSTASDIDIFLVRPRAVEEGDKDWRGQIDQLARDIRRWTGNQLGLAEISEEELGRLRHKRPEVVESLRADAITLVGPSTADLLRRRR